MARLPTFRRPQWVERAAAALSRHTSSPINNTVISDTNPPLFSLPIEIFDQVTSFLPSESVTALMLTCHELYDAFSPILKLDMDKPAKIRFLQLLEQQIPKHYLCHGCATYHPLLAKDEPRKYAKFLMPAQRQKKCGDYQRGKVFYHHYSVDFRHVRLAVRGAQLGPDHGIPLRAFSHCDSFPIGVDGRAWRFMEARVIGGELYLKGSYEFTGWEAPSASGPWGPGVAKEIGKREWRICPHTVFGPDMSLEVDKDVETLLLKWMSRAVAYGKRGVLICRHHCSHCHTDIRISLSAKTKWGFGKGTGLAVYFCRNLGTGCSPEDPKWQAAAEVYGKPMRSQRLRTAENHVDVWDAWWADNKGKKTVE